METLRIAVVGPSLNKVPPDGYGSERALYWLALGLARRGHEVHLYAPYRRISDDGIVRHPMRYTPAQVSLQAEASAWDQDVERMDFVLDASATCIFHELVHWRAKRHVPHACWRNGMDFSHPRIYRHNIVVLSQLARQHALEGRGAYVGPYYRPEAMPKVADPVVIGYGLPAPRRRSCGHDGGYHLWLSRFTPEKGVFEVLRAAKRARGERFVLAGDARYGDHAMYYAMARDLASSLDNVRLVPNPSEEEKEELMCGAQDFLYPVQYAEAFGLVILEAASLGTPIVVPEESVKFITPELRPVVERPSWETLERLGFTVDAMVERWLSFIERAVGGYETRE